MASKITAPAQNRVNDLTSAHVKAFNPSVPGEFVFVPTREPKKGTDKVPDVSADVKILKVGNTVRHYVAAKCRVASTAFQSIAFAAAKCKHKVATGAKGGKVPAEMVKESERLLKVLMAERKQTISQLESDAQFLILAQPASEGKTLQSSRIKVEGVGAFHFKESAKDSPEAQENRAALVAILLHVNGILSANGSAVIEYANGADLKAEADKAEADEAAILADVAEKLRAMPEETLAAVAAVVNG